MRRLHPVGINEIFVASGEYRSSLHADFRQTWTIHAASQNGQLIRGESANDEGYDLDELVIDQQQGIIRFNRESFSGRSRYQKMACYFSALHIDQSIWHLDDTDAVVSETDYASDFEYTSKRWQEFHYPYIAYGLMLRDLLRISTEVDVTTWGEKAVIIPTLVGEELLSMGNKVLATKKYVWLTWEIWLDMHDIPLKIKQTMLDETITLHNYAHR